MKNRSTLVLALAALAALALPQAACNRLVQCDCAPAPGIILHVVDATSGAPVPDPSFSDNGRQNTSFCADYLDGGGCGAWHFYGVGRHTIVVSAPGYVMQTVEADAGSVDTGACCDPRPARLDEQTVMLTRI